MANTYKKLAQGYLPAATAALYTVPASTSAIIRHIRLVNNDSSSRTAGLYHDGTTNQERILPTSNIVAGGWAEFDGVITCEAADTIQGVASVASQVSYAIYGVEIT